MYTHRTNLLLTKTDYKNLKNLAKEKGVTIGALIREAIKIAYTKEQKSQAMIIKDMQKIAKDVKTKDINYKDLINEGKK